MELPKTQFYLTISCNPKIDVLVQAWLISLEKKTLLNFFGGLFSQKVSFFAQKMFSGLFRGRWVQKSYVHQYSYRSRNSCFSLFCLKKIIILTFFAKSGMKNVKTR